MSSAPAAMKAKPLAPDTSTAPTTAKANTPTPPSYPPPDPNERPWCNTGTAHIAALRGELKEQIEEESQYATT